LSWKRFKKVEILNNLENKVQIGCENYFWTTHKVEVANFLKDLQNNLKGDFFGNAESFFDNADKKVDQVSGFMDRAFSFLDNLGTSLEELADKVPVENKMIEVKEFHEVTDDRSQHVITQEAIEAPACPPPIPQQDMWHIAINGKQEGPYDISTIKNLIIERSISKTNYHVWKKGMTDWSLMSEVDEFEDIKDITRPTPNINSDNSNNKNSINSGDQNTTPISSMITIICENCSQKMKVPRKTSNIIITCPKCRKEYPHIS
jgi:hypothetical protein